MHFVGDGLRAHSRVAEIQLMGPNEVPEVAGCHNSDGMPRPPESNPERNVRLDIATTTQGNNGYSHVASIT